jgi:hypothetical protein
LSIEPFERYSIESVRLWVRQVDGGYFSAHVYDRLEVQNVLSLGREVARGVSEGVRFLPGSEFMTARPVAEKTWADCNNGLFFQVASHLDTGISLVAIALGYPERRRPGC